MVIYHSNNTRLPDSRRGSVCPKASPDLRGSHEQEDLTWKPAATQPESLALFFLSVHRVPEKAIFPKPPHLSKSEVTVGCLLKSGGAGNQYLTLDTHKVL